MSSPTRLDATRASVPGGLLVHPVALLALGIWLLNDHVLKPAWHDELTGKLSDVASLVFFPLLPVAVREMVLASTRSVVHPSRAWALFWVAATGLVLATINTLDVAAEAYRVGLGVAQWPFRVVVAGALVPLRPVALWMDPTDLATLPALVVPLALTWWRMPVSYRATAATTSRENARRGERGAKLVAVIGALAMIATSPAQNHRVSATATFELEAGAPVHVIVRVSRAALRHADFGELDIRGEGPDGRLIVTPDDASLVAELAPPPASDRQFASVPLGDLDELCPGDDACDLGFELVVDAVEGTFSVGVTATLSRVADDTRLLLPEDRSFPEDARIEVLLE